DAEAKRRDRHRVDDRDHIARDRAGGAAERRRQHRDQDAEGFVHRALGSSPDASGSGAARGVRVAIAIPARTAITPIARLRPNGSPIASAAKIDALIGWTAMVLAARVGEAC